MKPIFLCYTKCSTCRRARQFLKDHGIEVTERDIVTENPTRDEILSWMDRFDGPPKRFFNTSGQLYRAMALKDKVGQMSKEEMADLLATDGMLVKRPELIFEDKVLVGFKEALWAEALNIEL